LLVRTGTGSFLVRDQRRPEDPNMGEAKCQRDKIRVCVKGGRKNGRSLGLRDIKKPL